MQRTQAGVAQGPHGWRERGIQSHPLKTPSPLTGIIGRLSEDLWWVHKWEQKNGYLRPHGLRCKVRPRMVDSSKVTEDS